MSDLKLPGISVIIPTRNEENFIEECINSLIDCDEPRYINNTEFIIVDGMSTDKILDIVKEKFSHLKLKIFKNPNLYQAYAMNIGIENSDSSDKNSIIIRADAHSRYPSNYIRSC
jgi:glycosyltransferase involved in cell wall biosynthesis